MRLRGDVVCADLLCKLDNLHLVVGQQWSENRCCDGRLYRHHVRQGLRCHLSKIVASAQRKRAFLTHDDFSDAQHGAAVEDDEVGIVHVHRHLLLDVEQGHDVQGRAELESGEELDKLLDFFLALPARLRIAGKVHKNEVAPTAHHQPRGNRTVDAARDETDDLA